MSLVQKAIRILTITVMQKVYRPTCVHLRKNYLQSPVPPQASPRALSTSSEISTYISSCLSIHPWNTAVTKIKQYNVSATWILSSLCASNEYVFECVYWWSGQQSPLPCITHANKLFKWKFFHLWKPALNPFNQHLAVSSLLWMYNIAYNLLILTPW